MQTSVLPVKYVLDTNVISATVPTLAAANGGLVDWLTRNSHLLHMSAITLSEIVSGIAKCQRMGETRKASQLGAWFSLVRHHYADRILPLDQAAAMETGRLMDVALAAGRSPGYADMAIAGITAANGMVLLTRNLKDFAPLGLAVHDPFASLPPG